MERFVADVGSLKFQLEVNPNPEDVFVKLTALDEQLLFGLKVKFAVGTAYTVIMTLSVAVEPLLETVTVYVVVVVGDAMGFEIFVALSPEAGAHV